MASNEGMGRYLFALTLPVFLLAQAPVRIPKPEPPKPQRPQPGQLSTGTPAAKEEPSPSTIRVETKVVLAPTVVYDANGRMINGLQLHNFEVFDNDKPQDFKVDVSYQP